MAQNLRHDATKINLTREEAIKLLDYVNSLERAMADILRSVYEREISRTNKEPAA